MLPSRSSAQCLMLNFSTFWWSTEEDVVALVIEYFTPEHHGSWQDLRPDKSSPTICSPWLEALPLLLDRSRRTSRNAPLLSASLRTLGYSIVCKGYEDSTRSQWDICRAEYYAKAAQSLNRELTEGTGVCDESAAAIMCLIMAEIVEACLSRQDTFLSSYEWQTIPFSLHEAPPFQMLLGHGSVLPSLLRKLQSLHLFSDEVKGSMAQNILTGLLTTLQELEAWEHSMQSAVQGPLFWPRAACPTQQTVNDSVQLSLWFSSLPVATSLSYLWAFRAVCYKQIAHLLSSDLAPPSCRDRALACLNLPGIKDCQKKSLAFHSMICQSIPYFMQYEMKFYGAASVTLPLMLTQMVL
ncbi:hypothetical protein N7450_002498 [Penicillium hetheringtonii]|nr:hypothetical protein N7450_002498 [Penicillium hetheringtonii]